MDSETAEVHRSILDRLETAADHLSWDTERARDKADISGRNSQGVVYIEVEMKREDPVTNIAKHARRAANTDLGQVMLFHVFSEFYYTSSLGFDSRRKDAVFVGKLASRQLEKFSYQAINLNLLPPRQSEPSLPDTYPPEDERQDAAVEVADEVAVQLDGYEPTDGEQLTDY